MPTDPETVTEMPTAAPKPTGDVQLNAVFALHAVVAHAIVDKLMVAHKSTGPKPAPTNVIVDPPDGGVLRGLTFVTAGVS